MSALNWPRDRRTDGRVADVRFMEVELPAAVELRQVIETESGLRMLLANPMDIGLVSDFIAHLRATGREAEVIGLGMSDLKVYLAVEPCDMRKGFNGLTTAAVEQLAQPLARDALFVFINKRQKHLSFSIPI